MISAIESCSASIAVESYRSNWNPESDNGRKGELISYEHYIHSAFIEKTISFLSSWLSPECSNYKAPCTLFANNSEIGVKRRKNSIQWIVYKRRLPCFANRFFDICCTQDLHRGSGLVDDHKVFFRRKKIICCEQQCTATRSSHFRQQYFIRRKNNFVPYSSCSWIVCSGLNALQRKHISNLQRQIFVNFSKLELLLRSYTTYSAAIRRGRKIPVPFFTLCSQSSQFPRNLRLLVADPPTLGALQAN